ncbi:MAG TPA: ATP-binding protein, partial [Segetibacter sp.]
FAKAKNLELPLAEYSLILSEIFLKIKNYDKALQYALQSYNLATENNSKRQIEQTSAAIANIYEKQHDYSKALRFLHIYLDIKNSLFNEEINKRIIEQEVEYKYEKEKQAATDKARLTKVILTAVIILLVIVAAMIIYKNRVSQILRVENLRRKISSDLHDDIGATLSSINIYSELAKREKENTAFLQTIQEQATSTVSALDDLVWSINPNNDNLKVLIERMRSYALPVLLDNKIKAEFIAEMKDEEVAISLEKRRSIYFAFKEMVANVLKHANCRSCVITVKQSSSNLTIEVTDDGRGFDLNNINHQRNGLRNLQTRAKENGGHFSVVSEVGKGTASSFSVALKSRNFAM